MFAFINSGNFRTAPEAAELTLSHCSDEETNQEISSLILAPLSTHLSQFLHLLAGLQASCRMLLQNNCRQYGKSLITQPKSCLLH